MQKAYPRFIPLTRSQFFPVLQKRVNDYFKDNGISRHADSRMIVKSIALISTFVISLLLLNTLRLNTAAVIGLYALCGFALAGIGMSVMHDANHGAYSPKPWVNKWMGYSLNLIGGMVFNWKLQHNVLHHTYTNVHGMDDDIADKLVLRFSPHSDVKKMHRFQYLYVFFFYSILTLYWFLAKDFVQYYQYRRRCVNRFSGTQNRRYFASMVLLKLFFLSYTVLLPILLQGYSVALILSGFLLMNAISGLVLGIVFQLAHSVEEAAYPLPTAANVIENDWAIHQMDTTVNFARDNKLLSWYIGGLNFQVEHHLFPNICHVHYPAISKIVEQTASEYGVQYRCAPGIAQAFSSHMKMLKKFGYVFEADLARM